MNEFEPVVLPAILMSDGAITEIGTGKLSLIGVFTQVNCPTFPFQAPQFVLSVFLTNFRGASEDVNVTARVEVCGSAQVVASMSAKLKFQPGQKPPEGAVIPLSFRIPGMIIPQPGKYRVVILVNEDKVSEHFFMVVGITAPSPQH